MVRHDCRHYRGDKPCKHKRACQGCNLYDAVKERILVIKLGALGDLLRTTSLLPALRKKYPDAKITWITSPECVPLLENVHEIDEVWTTDSDLTARVLARKFDLALNFDKEAPAPELLTLAQAGIKRGFLIGPANTLAAANPASNYALRLGIDDDLKFHRNQESYPAIIHEMAELRLPSPVPRPLLFLRPEERASARTLLETAAGGALPEGPLLGIHPGASARFATKRWHWERYAATAVRLHREHGIVPVLFGGVAEEPLLARIEDYCLRSGVTPLRPAPLGNELSLRQFCAAVAECDGILCGDTLALHVALALSVPTVAILLSTCHQEIETYATATMIIGRAECAPCYLSKCNQPSQICADSVSVEEVAGAVAERLGSAERRRKAG